MNKKLLALAVAAALAPAAAMADSGNVTVYGIMDASYDITDNGTGAAAGAASGIRANKVSSNSSRLGFKGTEDVGNGLNAVWQIETGINADGTAASNLNSRNTFVGLSSKSAGTVILGRHDTPYKLATRGLDYFGDGLADNRNIMGGGAGSTLGTAPTITYPAGTFASGVLANGTAASFNGSAASFDGRQSDVVAYISPTVNGLTGAIAYVAGAEGVTTSGQTKGDAWSAMANYANGPMYAALAYERHNFGTKGTGDLGATAISNTTGATSGFADRMEKAWKLGLGYKFGDLDVGFAYEKTSDDLNAGSNLLGHNAWTLGGKYKIASNDLKLAYTKAGNNAADKTGANQWAVGVDHNMSKRTKVYAQYVRLNNDDSATYGLNGAGATGLVSANGAGADPSAWSFGMRHSF